MPCVLTCLVLETRSFFTNRTRKRVSLVWTGVPAKIGRSLMHQFLYGWQSAYVGFMA
jgi:hypothetical protein